ncbi:MAG: exonuclease domain-containing protein [Verrucomicrobia bacterium]|nr:exonuclease domain-containing protein [Verrucomicrobiota bacterium]
MKVPCPQCANSLTRPRSAMGTRVVCPECGHSFYWTDCRHAGETFVVYDLETTGLNPELEEFIQIAAIRFSSGCLCPEETFTSFAKPRRPISSFIESYTGVGNWHVRHANRPEEVLCEFAVWSGDATLIAHNGLRFDSKFLSATCRRHGLPTREIQCIDSIHMSKMLFGKARGTGHSMDHLMSRLRIDSQGLRRHDARGDVEILGRAVAGMWQQLGLDRSFNGVPRHRAFLPLDR